jgi:predicted GNAT family acetyltransferase
MRDEEIDQSYARAEVEWLKRESGEGARSSRRVDVCHTYTPPERRGRGEGARVVGQLIAWARSTVTAETVVASCSFARRVLDKADE